jgi:predicted kinase
LRLSHLVHINPDHFLETPQGRVTTPERNAEAWRQCHAALSEALAPLHSASALYVLVGAQGSGKSTWARRLVQREPRAVVFDAILVKRAERAPLLAQARQHGVPAIAVWFRTSLDECLARNAARPPDEVVDDQAIRNVFAAVEAPTAQEGFDRVIVGAQGTP